MKPRLSLVSVLSASLTLSLASASFGQEFQTPYTEWGVPDLQGNWKNATVMPFERPSELGTKQAYNEEEAMLSEAFYVKENSRLGCQIQINPEMEGLKIEIAPES